MKIFFSSPKKHTRGCLVMKSLLHFSRRIKCFLLFYIYILFVLSTPPIHVSVSLLYLRPPWVGNRSMCQEVPRTAVSLRNNSFGCLWSKNNQLSRIGVKGIISALYVNTNCYCKCNAFLFGTN